MITDVKNFNQLRQKMPRGQVAPTKPALGATAAMYMPSDRRNEVVNTDIIVPEKEKRRIAKAMGAIFGVREGGTWSFYYERLLRFDYSIWTDVTNWVEVSEDNWVEQTKKGWEYKTQGFQLDANVTKFWPDGSGHVVG